MMPLEILDDTAFVRIGLDEPYRIIVQNNPVNYIDPFGLARGDWYDPRTYIDISYSLSSLIEGKQINRNKTEQTVYSLTLVGASYDMQIGSLPCEKDVQVEFSIGLGKHLGVGIYFAAPGEGGDINKGGLALHLGIAVGSPINVSGTLPVNSHPRWW
jgi:hypothetical protein